MTITNLEDTSRQSHKERRHIPALAVHLRSGAGICGGGEVSGEEKQKPA